ncbi:hypothetical protein ACCI38_001116 [Vibrio parahaemolyticus]
MVRYIESGRLSINNNWGERAIHSFCG